MGNLLTLSLLKDLIGKKSRPITILMVGLESSGKTSFLNKLKLSPGKVTTSSSMGYDIETVQYENISLKTVRVGMVASQVDSQDKSGNTSRNTGLNIGPLPWHCFPNTKGLIFVVDSNNRQRLIEAKGHLNHMLNENALKHASLLVFANKKDLPTSMNAGDLADALGLKNIRNRPWYIQSACATTTNPGQGFYEGLGWLSSTMVKYKGL